jgi:hypothetical protein
MILPRDGSIRIRHRTGWIDLRTEFDDAPGGFAARCSRQLDGDRQPRFFQPEIEMIEATGLYLHNDFANAGFWLR